MLMPLRLIRLRTLGWSLCSSSCPLVQPFLHIRHHYLSACLTHYIVPVHHIVAYKCPLVCRFLFAEILLLIALHSSWDFQLQCTFKKMLLAMHRNTTQFFSSGRSWMCTGSCHPVPFTSSTATLCNIS